jgi:hypothetical protein
VVAALTDGVDRGLKLRTAWLLAAYVASDPRRFCAGRARPGRSRMPGCRKYQWRTGIWHVLLSSSPNLLPSHFVVGAWIRIVIRMAMKVTDAIS